MKTVDASRPGISVLLIGIGIVLYAVSIIVFMSGLADVAQSNSGIGGVVSGASGFIFATILIGLAAIITRLHSIEAYLKAYVLHATALPPIPNEKFGA
jgi:polyferredoxin